jgi:hypothetical protein
MYSIDKQPFRQSDTLPRSFPGAGVRPLLLSLSLPLKARGAARREGACPGLLTGRSGLLRTGPDRRALALMTRAPAPLGAPPRHRSAFAFYGGRTGRGPYYPGRVLPGGRPRAWVRTTPAGAASRPTSYDASAEAPPQSAGLTSHIVKFTRGVNRPRALIRIATTSRSWRRPIRLNRHAKPATQEVADARDKPHRADVQSAARNGCSMPSRICSTRSPCCRSMFPPMPNTGTIRSQLEAAGRPIGGNDLLIAAHACTIGTTIVTANAPTSSNVSVA